MTSLVLMDLPRRGRVPFWTRGVNVTTTDTTITKDAGGAAWNAGAVSSRGLLSGDGYAEFVATETNTFRAFGLTSGTDTWQHYNEINFAIVLYSAGGAVHVYELGVDKGALSTYTTGDTFRVEVSSGAVLYKKNGTTFYTSLTAPTYPLAIDTSLHGATASLASVVLSGTLGLYPWGVTKTRRLICDGNSLTQGSGLTIPYPTRLGTLLGATWGVFNFGVGGQTTAAMIADAATQVDILYSADFTKNIVVAWEGTNHLRGGATAAQAYASLVTYCQGRRAAGFQVVIITILPCSGAGTPGTFEADRQTVNTSIRADWATFADALYDIAADSRIGDAGDELDATYYNADRIHLNDTGAAIVAAGVNTQVLTL